LSNRPFANCGDKILGDLEVDVRFEQGATNFAHRLVDVLFGQSSLPSKTTESLLKSV
jgi:hypothetical protein